MLNNLSCNLLVIPTKLENQTNDGGGDYLKHRRLTWPDFAAVTGQFVSFSILKVSTFCMRDAPIAGVLGCT